VHIRNPHDARAHGVAMVFQHFSLFDTLTVAQNVWLGLDERCTLDNVAQRIRAKAQGYGLPIEPERPVASLSVGERQRVEIIRALLSDPRILILDEPTSVLTPAAVQTLFATLRQLAAEGCAIVYISHKLDEIRALCSRCTVLRAGRVTGVVDPREHSNASLSKLMIGAEPPSLVHRKVVAGPVALSVQHLSQSANSTFGTALHDIGFELRAGEVLGVAGVSGNGQQELLALLSGEARAPSRGHAGSITLLGQDISRANPAARRAMGLHFVPEERLGRGAVPTASLAANTLLTRREPLGPMGWIRQHIAHELAARVIQRFGVKAPGAQAAAQNLSGGNLQKYIVGREVDAKPRVLIVAQPTWGVDVGAAAQIRAELLALRDGGCAVLVVSEELEELFELSDRLVVMAGGRLSPAVPTREATIEQIGAWMGGAFFKTLAAQHAAA
jgi:general nucleoside transport system ATP-binding protein